jgi:amino acid transporter
LIPKDKLKPNQRVKVMVATSVMLSFISFWRAAAIVLNDLGSSAFYAGGIAEDAIGKAAPWFVLAVMLFSYAVRALYIESSSMFTRGGVYRVVKEAMGGTMAKLSVSALLFDFILTGPMSGVSAGQYIVGLIAQIMTYAGYPWQPSEQTINHLAAGSAVLITLYFWWRNIKGIHESSDDALRIMYVTTVMVVLMILWSGATLLLRGGQMPPLPLPRNLRFSEDALGWLKHWHWFSHDGERSALIGNIPKFIGLTGIMIAFGHSVLAMSGEETLAQVNRELEYPKLKNLKRAGLVIFIYSLLFTSLVSFFAVALISDKERPKYLNNLISGLAMNLAGPVYLKLIFQAFVVFVGFLMLAGAVNTAIIGSNGVLNRVSEDGVLTEWFRAPQKKYGTAYRIINLIAILQIVTLIGSRGNIFVLGEAYAFGLVWSFAFNAVATLVLRYTRPKGREWKVPGNLKIAGMEVPFGLIVIALILTSVAVINLFTKEVATVAGMAFTGVFFTLFTVSERLNRRKQDLSIATLDQFQLQQAEQVDAEAIGARPGSVLVPVRDYNTLQHLDVVLEDTNTEERDIVVMTVRVLLGADAAYDMLAESPLSDYERRLFSRVVALAEKHGKPVDLTIVPSNNVFDAIAQTAVRLDSAVIIAGLSSKMNTQDQAREMGRAWERLTEKPRRPVRFSVVGNDAQRVEEVCLGAHGPNLTEDDINLIHRIWLQIGKVPARSKIHHRDVVRVALERLERDLRGRSDAMLDFYKIEHRDGRETGPRARGKKESPDNNQT